jgi:hypothetical protein
MFRIIFEKLFTGERIDQKGSPTNFDHVRTQAKEMFFQKLSLFKVLCNALIKWKQ